MTVFFISKRGILHIVWTALEVSVIVLSHVFCKCDRLKFRRKKFRNQTLYSVLKLNTPFQTRLNFRHFHLQCTLIFFARWKEFV